MWLFTRYGFYSIVRKPWQGKEGEYQVRSRVKVDLENLQRASGIKKSIITVTYADYKYRMLVTKDELKHLMVILGESIDYKNFKSEISRNPVQEDKLEAYFRIHDETVTFQK